MRDDPAATTGVQGEVFTLLHSSDIVAIGRTMADPLPGEQLSIVVPTAELRVGMVPFRPSPKFFSLYCLLALARLEAPGRHGGYVDAATIRSLAPWRRTAKASVGKEIRRYVLRTPHGLIEALRPTAGPFRLAVPASGILIDGGADALRAFLRSDLDAARLDVTSIRRNLAYVAEIAIGWKDFEAGNVTGAARSFERAARLTNDIGGQTYARNQHARMLERLGKYKDAFAVYECSVDALAAVGTSQDSLEYGFVLAYRSWLEYRAQRLEKAERGFDEARRLASARWNQRLLGDVANGIGEIAARRRDWQLAAQQYNAAIRFWTDDGYVYGLQAAYCNLAEALGYLSDDAPVRQKRRTLTTARLCVEFAIDLCDRFDIAYDTNDNLMVLGRLLWKLNRKADSLLVVKKAVERAAAVDNQLELRDALCLLVEVGGACERDERGDVLSRRLEQLRDASARDMIIEKCREAGL